MSPSTINELLCFVATQFDKLDKANICSILARFYTLDELVVSKQLLVSECEKIKVTEEISDYKKRRLKKRIKELKKRDPFIYK